MRQLTRTFASLAILLAGSALLAWFTWRGDDAGPARVTLQDSRAFGAESAAAIAAADAISLEAQGTVVSLQRDSGEWWVTSPQRLRADDEVVGAWLARFAALPSEESLPDAPAPLPEAWGLGAGAPTVQVWRRGPAESHAARFQVWLGAQSGFNRLVYARAQAPGGNARLLMTSALAAADLLVPAERFFERRPLGVVSERVEQVRVTPRSPSPERVVFSLRRNEGSVVAGGATDRTLAPCALEVPRVADADEHVCAELWSAFAALPIARFPTLDHRGDLAAWGLAAPDFTVEVTLRATEPGGALERRTLLVGAPRGEEGAAPTLLIARADTAWVGEVNGALHSLLARGLPALVSKRLVAVDPNRVHRVEVAQPALGTMEWERAPAPPGQEPAWRMLSPEPGAVSGGKMRQLLATFSDVVGSIREAEGARARDETLRRSWGLSRGAATEIRLLDAEGALLAEVWLGHVQGDEVFASALGRDFVVRLPRARLDVLPPSAEAWHTPPTP